MKSTNLLNIVLLIFVSTFFIQCSKDDDPKENEIEVSDDITADKNTVSPLEIVQLTSKNTLQADIYEANLGNVSLKLAKVDDNTLILVVPPDIQSGKSILTFMENEKTVEIEFNVLPLELVADPESVIQPMLVEVDLILNQSPTNPELISYASSLESLMAEFESAYNSLSIENKKKVATFFELNVFSNIESKTANNEECFNANVKKFLVSKATLALSITALVTCVVFPEPFISKVVAIGAAIVFVSNVYVTQDAAMELLKCDALKEVSDFDSELFGEKNSKESAGKASFVYENLTSYKMTFSGEFSGVSRDDLTNQNTFFKDIAEKIIDFEKLIEKGKIAYQNAKEFFGISSEVSSGNSQILPATSENSQVIEIENTFISSLTLVANEYVAIKSQSITETDVLLTMSNKTIEDQDFEFEVTANDNVSTASKIFSAQVKASDGFIHVLKGNNETIGDDYEVIIEVKITNEEEEAVKDALVVFASASEKVSFSASSIKTNADGIVTITANVSEDNNEDIPVKVSLKNNAGEIIKESSLTLVYDNPYIGTWVMETFEEGIPLGEYVTFQEQCNKVIKEWTYTSETIVIESDTWSSSGNYRERNFHLAWQEGCVILDYYQESIVDFPYSDGGTYTRNGGQITTTVEGQEVTGTGYFITENKLKIGDKTYNRQ